MKRTALSLLFAVLVISCGGKKSKPQKIDDLFSKVEMGKTESTNFQSDELIDPIYQLCVDRYLLIGSFFIDPMIKVYDLESQRPVKALLSKGKAKNEILQIGSLSLYRDKLVVKSNNDLKMAYIDTVLLSSETHSIATRQIGDTKKVHCLNICPIQSDRYLATGYNTEGENNYFYVLDSTLSLEAGMDTYPEVKQNQSLNPNEMALGYQGRLVGSPAGDYVIFNSFNGCILKFFDCTGEMPVKVREYVLETPRFTAKPDHSGALWDKNNIQGVLSTAVDDAHFYLLYSDKKISDHKRESKAIYVFDYKGTPIKKIEIDVPATAIVYSEYDHALYLFTTNDRAEPVLRKMSLVIA